MKKFARQVAVVSALMSGNLVIPAAAFFCDAAIFPDLSIKLDADVEARRVVAIATHGLSRSTETPAHFEKCLRSMKLDKYSSLTEFEHQAASRYLTETFGAPQEHPGEKCVGRMSVHSWSGRTPSVAGARPTTIIGFGACVGSKCLPFTFFARSKPHPHQLLQIAELVAARPQQLGHMCIVDEGYVS